MMDGGRPISRVNWSIFAVALPSGTSGARLKLSVIACSWPWWLTAVGPSSRLTLANAVSGTIVLFLPRK